MSDLARQRCLQHPAREAAARCPECAQFYCRECIVENEDRILCGSCLKKLTQSNRMDGRGAGTAFRVAHLALSLVVLWLCFYSLGKTLLAIPASFHEGEIWKLPNLQ